ncbi:MAG: ABC transporter permease, partial [Vicinamibacteraceae bacterium]
MILSHALWQRRFTEDPGVIGRSILLDNRPHTVIGVMPRGFQFPRGDTQAWTPPQFPMEAGSTTREAHFLDVVGRLNRDVSLAQAQAEMNTIARRLAEAYPKTNKDWGTVVVPLHGELVREVRTSFWLLVAASGLVLLIACANVANLIATRGVGRAREMSVRCALGASGWQICRQLLTEALVLSGAAGLIGILIAMAAFRALETLIPPTLAGAVHPTLNLRLLVFSLAVSLLTACAFALVPFRQTFRRDLTRSLSARDVAGERPDRSRPVLVALETALAVVVVASTGLMIRTILNLEAVDPGFRSDHVITARVELSRTRYAEAEDRIAFYREVLERIHRLPGVVAAGFTTFLPYTNFSGTFGLLIEGRPDLPDAMKITWRREVTPRYFAAIGVPLIAGRWFTEHDDRDSAAVAIVSEQTAKLFPGEAIGKRLRFAGDDSWLTVVGVVGTIREDGLDTPSIHPTVYTPYSQSRQVWYFNPRDLAIRAYGAPTGLVAAVQREIWEIDPTQPLSRVQTLDAVVEGQLSPRKLQTTLLGVFAGLALFLAALGIHGVLSFVVAARRREFGVRIAVGAQASNVVVSVFRQSFAWIACGVTLGLAATVLATRALSSLLYGVTPTDVWTLSAAVLLLIGVG